MDKQVTLPTVTSLFVTNKQVSVDTVASLISQKYPFNSIIIISSIAQTEVREKYKMGRQPGESGSADIYYARYTGADGAVKNIQLVELVKGGLFEFTNAALDNILKNTHFIHVASILGESIYHPEFIIRTVESLSEDIDNRAVAYCDEAQHGSFGSINMFREPFNFRSFSKGQNMVGDDFVTTVTAVQRTQAKYSQQTSPLNNFSFLFNILHAGIAYHIPETLINTVYEVQTK